MDSEVCQTVDGANPCRCRIQKIPTQPQCFISDNPMFKLSVRYIDICCLSSEIIWWNFASVSDVVIYGFVHCIETIIRLEYLLGNSKCSGLIPFTNVMRITKPKQISLYTSLLIICPIDIYIAASEAFRLMEKAFVVFTYTAHIYVHADPYIYSLFVPLSYTFMHLNVSACMYACVLPPLPCLQKPDLPAVSHRGTLPPPPSP